MQKRLILLGTQGCHLCEQAEAILQALQLIYTSLDIMDDEKLLARYEMSIPVLLSENMDRLNPLCWPFTTDMVQHWLNVSRAEP